MNEEKQKVKQGIIEVWDKVAPTFGEVGPKYWCLFGKRLVELSSINRGAEVLDIGIGRGASLFPAIMKVGKEGKVIGIDISEVMVRETYKKILAQNIDNAEVMKMDAENLDFNEDSFDNIICGFSIGCLLFSDSKLKGVLRVLKKGGQVAFSAWGVQEDQKWLHPIVNKYLQISKPNKNSDTKPNILKFDTVEDMKKILEQSGFINIKVHEECTDVVYKDKEEWWKEMWSNAVRGIFERIEETGEEKFKEFKKEVFDELENFKYEGEFHFNMPVIYAFGEK